MTAVSQQFALDRGRVFIAGLFWHALIASDPRGEARQIAKQQSFQTAVFRMIDGKVVQAGFGSTSGGHREGMLSAAAAVSKSIEMERGPRDFMVATKIPDNRYLYVAQRDGAIHPDGDFIGTEEEVQARVLRDQTIGNWGYIVAPAHWGILDSEERSFDSFLPRKSGDRIQYHRWWALQSIQRKPVRTLLTLVALAGLVGGPLYGYRWHQERLAAEQAAALAEQAAAAAGQVTVARPEHPWKKLPLARAFVAACMDGIDRIPSLAPGNWTMVELNCNGSTVGISWRRGEGGWIEHLRLVAPEVTTSADGQSASLSMPVTLPPGESDEVVLEERQRTLALHAVAQIYRFTGLSVSAAVAPAPPLLPGQQAGQQPPPPPPEWKEMKWSMTGTAMTPGVVADALDGPGFRMSSIKAVLNGGSLSWSMEGTQYVAP